MLIPPFCPNDLCSYHSGVPDGRRWYRTKGSYRTAVSGEVKRFICLGCGRGFSEQTFRLDYYVKRKLSYDDIFHSITNGAGVRKLARHLKVGHQAILNRLSRLARQSMALQAELTAELALQEDLVTDGFESFVADQYQPNNIHILMGKDSQFLYSFDYAHLRRKGRMSETQRGERERRERQYIGRRISIAESFRQIVLSVEQLLASSQRPLSLLFSDQKIEYSRLIEGSWRLQELRSQGRFGHVRICSKAARTQHNPLFAVNYFDRQLRKDNANHVRQTVRFSRNVNNCMERFAVYQMQHNYFKPYRIDRRGKKELLHGQQAGIGRERIDRAVEDIFQFRRFFSKIGLSFSQLRLWARMIGTLDRFDGAYEPKFIWM